MPKEYISALNEIDEALEEELSRESEAPWLNKWGHEELELKTMLGIKELPRQHILPPEWPRYEQGILRDDRRIKEELVLRRLRMAWGLAKWHVSDLRTEELAFEDHFHHAIEGVYKGIEEYKPESEQSLPKQIGVWVYATLQKRAYDRGLIKLSSYAYGLLTIPDADLSDELGDKVQKIKSMLYENIVPLDQILCVAEQIPIEEIAASNIEQEIFLRALQKLPDRERRILEMHHGLNGNKPRTIREVEAEPEIKVRRARIFQLEIKAISRLLEMSSTQRIATDD